MPLNTRDDQRLLGDGLGTPEAGEADNPRLRGILDNRFGRTQLEPSRLASCP